MVEGESDLIFVSTLFQPSESRLNRSLLVRDMFGIETNPWLAVAASPMAPFFGL